VNRLTFDVILDSAGDYEMALRSNLFHKENVAEVLNLPAERVVGTFFVDTCNAIKITIDRLNISASVDEHDVFGAQQQSAIERLSIPTYIEALEMAPAFMSGSRWRSASTGGYRMNGQLILGPPLDILTRER
jgi:Domain of unknown function (DUF4387)